MQKEKKIILPIKLSLWIRMNDSVDNIPKKSIDKNI
jgi:hypothetical protein